MLVGILEEIKRGTKVIPVGNENLKNAVEVCGERLALELQHGVEGFEGFVGQIGFGIDFDEVGEDGGSEGLGIRFEAKKEIIEE